MRIVAVPGRKVRDHVTGRWVDADGIDADPNDLIWARYLADQDVAEATDLPTDAPADAEPEALLEEPAV